MAREFTDITYDERIVDAACMHLVMHPEKLDVLLLPNLYGDIVSDLCAGLVGGLGVVPGANLGAETRCSRRCTAARPTSRIRTWPIRLRLLLSGLLMLEHIGEREQAARIRAALDRVLAAGRVRTRDLGGHGEHHRSSRQKSAGKSADDAAKGQAPSTSLV